VRPYTVSALCISKLCHEKVIWVLKPRPDSLSAAKLASYGFATEQGKRRRLQLHGPDEDVRLELTGRMCVCFIPNQCKIR
jgi:hypothetical protein